MNLIDVESESRDTFLGLLELKLKLLAEGGAKQAASMALTPELIDELKRFGYMGD